MTQDYPADVSICPRQRLFDPRMLLSALSTEEAVALFEEGERSTWPKIEIVRSCTKVSRCIDALLADAEGRKAPTVPRAVSQSERVTAAS